MSLTAEPNEQHAILLAVARLEVKVDQILQTQKALREDMHGIEKRVRDVETRVTRVEHDYKQRKNWPTVLSAIAAVAAVVATVMHL